MSNEEKPPRKVASTYGLAYALALPTLTKIAREHGYALCPHGSMATDMDVLAFPWVENASEPDVLAEAIRESLGGMFAVGKSVQEARTLHPHGRLVYSILPSDLFLGVPHLPWSPWIDLSIAPKLKPSISHAEASSHQDPGDPSG